MRITILATGSRGDIEPFLALGQGLMRVGYQVRLAANSNFETLVEGHGLEFFPVEVDSFDFVQGQRAQSWLGSRNLFELAVNSARIINQGVLEKIHRGSIEACNDADAIIYHSFTLPTGYYIARQLQVPSLSVSIYPLSTGDHLPLSVSSRFSFGGSLNRLAHFLVEQFTWFVFWRFAKSFWKNELKVSLISPSRLLMREHRPLICGYSKVVVPRPPDAPDNVHIVGYLQCDTPIGWSPDLELVDFIESGPAPVFVGFASMGNPSKARETTELVFEALENSESRGVLVSGWNGLGEDVPLPDTVFTIKSVPYAWLLPKMSVIVHHAGAGTTGIALRAGKPNIAIPHFADNYYWARRINELGAGPKPIPRSKLTSDKLARAILQARQDRLMRQQAAKVGSQLRDENGVKVAVDLIGRHLAGLPKSLVV